MSLTSRKDAGTWQERTGHILISKWEMNLNDLCSQCSARHLPKIGSELSGPSLGQNSTTPWRDILQREYVSPLSLSEGSAFKTSSFAQLLCAHQLQLK